MTELEMEIQRVLGVATYVKLLPFEVNYYVWISNWHKHVHILDYIGKYAELLDSPTSNPYGHLYGSPVLALKFEDDKILYIRKEDFKII